jgi:CHAT domain-containing protein
VFKPDILPNDCRKAARSLGNLYCEQTRWQAAVSAYQTALQAAETLYQSANLLDSQAAELSETADLPRRAAYALARVGDLQKAVETLEQGRARGLSESLNRDRADLAQLEKTHPKLCQKYQEIANQLRNLEAQQRDRMAFDRQGLTPEALRDSAIALRQQLTEAIEKIRQVEGYGQFLSLPTFADIQRAVQGDRPLVYLVVTPTGSLALIVTGETIHDLWLDSFNETQLIELLNQTWFAAYGQFERDRQGWFDAIDAVTQQLWEPLMAAVIARLQQHQYQQATLIPTGYLSLLPLHAAWTADPSTATGRRYALDDIHFTYAPNARSLRAARAIAQGAAVNSMLAIDNPRQDLPNSGREVDAAIASFSQPVVLPHDQATVALVKDKLPTADIAHFACHGTANLTDPLNSGLLMSDNLLTLRDIFALNLAEQGGLRLAILSACETGMIGTKNADEAISLPTGLLQAGVAAVIASLWAVSDLSTMLLLRKFYELWRTESTEPSAALRQAQRWLRDRTEAEIAPLLGRRIRNPSHRPFSHPYHWAAFSYTGV